LRYRAIKADKPYIALAQQWLYQIQHGCPLGKQDDFLGRIAKDSIEQISQRIQLA